MAPGPHRERCWRKRRFWVSGSRRGAPGGVVLLGWSCPGAAKARGRGCLTGRAPRPGQGVQGRSAPVRPRGAGAPALAPEGRSLAASSGAGCWTHVEGATLKKPNVCGEAVSSFPWCRIGLVPVAPRGAVKHEARAVSPWFFDACRPWGIRSLRRRAAVPAEPARSRAPSSRGSVCAIVVTAILWLSRRS